MIVWHQIMQIRSYKTSKFDWTPDNIRRERFQDFLNSMGLISNSIQGLLTVLCLKKEALGS